MNYQNNLEDIYKPIKEKIYNCDMEYLSNMEININNLKKFIYFGYDLIHYNLTDIHKETIYFIKSNNYELLEQSIDKKHHDDDYNPKLNFRMGTDIFEIKFSIEYFKNTNEIEIRFTQCKVSDKYYSCEKNIKFLLNNFDEFNTNMQDCYLEYLEGIINIIKEKKQEHINKMLIYDEMISYILPT